MLIVGADESDVIIIDDVDVSQFREVEPEPEPIDEFAIADDVLDIDELDVLLHLLENQKHSLDEDEDEDELHLHHIVEQIDEVDDDENDETNVEIEGVRHSIEDDDEVLEWGQENYDELDINDLLLLDILHLVDIQLLDDNVAILATDINIIVLHLVEQLLLHNKKRLY